jgi:Tol biopolymer transport system component/predicted Ser/Thr protein kinase
MIQPMSLQIGQQLGSYQITSLLGKGGMGEVYRARDTRVEREVAIKVSAERFGERFSREAQAIASLNHPNICTLYDVGPDYLVMEFVEGESPRGPLSLETALDYARQIAAALEAAHDRGIVHRDLKPGNIMITPQGTVKVLDFGLAKVMSATASGALTENSPTFSMAATQAGVILGTAAYMAPEQARGMAVDKRADIWAFGVVLYEMLTGRRLFQGDDLTDTLAAVVRDKPDLSAVPAEVRRLLEKCLEKDPKKRLRDISGVQLLLESESPVEVQSRPRSTRWPLAVAAAAVAGLASIAFIHFRETAPESQAVMFSVDAPADSSFYLQYGGFAASPDGRYVILAVRSKTGTSSLWVRPLDSLAARPLPGTEGGNFPTWSPDSRSIAFLADNRLKRIEIAGGAPLTLGDVASSRVSPTGTWNRDGVILFGSAAGLQRVSASGGGATPLTKVDPSRKETGHGYPQFLPDGNRFLYFVESGDPNVQGVYASSLANASQRQQILRTGAKAVYVPPAGRYPGYLLWLQDRTLLAQRFDPNALKLEDNPLSVGEGIGLNPGISVRSAFWASDAGLLVYFSNPLGTKRPVVWMSRDGKQLEEAAPVDAYIGLSLAPGAERMAMVRAERAGPGRQNFDVWLREFSRGVMTRLTFNPADYRTPVWSPDGKYVAFVSDGAGSVFQIYRKESSGSGSEERLTEGDYSKSLLDWSKDGRYLLYREETPTGRDLMALPLAGDRKPITIVKTGFLESTGAISPDGRWVAYASNDSGTNQLYVQAFPGDGTGPKGRWQISNGTAFDVKWRGDGKELYYETADGSGKVMAAAIQTGPEGVRAETPRVLFTADFFQLGLHQFDVTSDGNRFLMMLNPSAEGNVDRLIVVTNWQAALRK